MNRLINTCNKTRIATYYLVLSDMRLKPSMFELPYAPGRAQRYMNYIYPPNPFHHIRQILVLSTYGDGSVVQNVRLDVFDESDFSGLADAHVLQILLAFGISVGKRDSIDADAVLYLMEMQCFI